MRALLEREFLIDKVYVNNLYLQQHSDPDYSCTYVVLKTNEDDYKGYGLTFTLGRGNEIGTYHNGITH